MDNKELRHQLLDYLERPHTHAPLAGILKDFQEKLMNKKPEGVPYSFWQMLEHIRISQFDMIDFIQNPNYKEMEWPKDYWPSKEEKADKKMWKQSIDNFEKDYDALKEIVKNDEIDIMAPIAHGTGQTVFREILQIIDHNSYHIGELVIMMRASKAWKKDG